MIVNGSVDDVNGAALRLVTVAMGSKRCVAASLLAGAQDSSRAAAVVVGGERPTAVLHDIAKKEGGSNWWLGGGEVIGGLGWVGFGSLRVMEGLCDREGVQMD